MQYQSKGIPHSGLKESIKKLTLTADDESDQAFLVQLFKFFMTEKLAKARMQLFIQQTDKDLTADSTSIVRNIKAGEVVSHRKLYFRCHPMPLHRMDRALEALQREGAVAKNAKGWTKLVAK